MMKKPLRKLIAFSTALAAMMSGTILNASAVYVAEKIEDCDYDTLIQMRDKDILIKDGSAESIGEDTQLVVIDENGEKQLIDKNLGINGIYSYVSTTMGLYNYISPTNPAYSFDFFDESYRISTEADTFIVGIGDKFAVMDNDQNIISGEYNNIYRINDDYFIIDDSTDSTYSYDNTEGNGFDDNKSGLMKSDGTVIVPPTDGVIGFYLTADKNNFLVNTEDGMYFMDLSGNAVTETYSRINDQWDGDSYIDNKHFNTDKYRANYLLNGGAYEAYDENEKITLISPELKIIAENADYAYTSTTADGAVHWTVTIGETTYQYDENFNLISQNTKPEIDETYGIGYWGNGFYAIVSFAAIKDNEVSLWNADYSASTPVDLKLPEGAEIDYIDFSSYNDDLEFGINVGYYLNGEFVGDSRYYMVSTDLQYIEVSDLNNADWLEFGKNIKYTDPETNCVNIMDMSGNVIFSAPEGFNDFQEIADSVYNEETDSYDRVVNGYILSSDSAFSVYDLDWNPLWENIPGYFSYLPWDKNYFSDTDEGRKYGIFTLEDGVVLEPQFDSVKESGDGYFAVNNGILYGINADGSALNQWNDTYEYDTTTHSSYDTIRNIGDKYSAIIEGNTVILDSDMNIIQEWSGIYTFESGTYSAYTIDHTFNKRENGVTSTIVYNSETNNIDYQQEGEYDHVSCCLAGYMIVTNYDDSDSLWSGKQSQGIIKLDGTEVISPSEALNIAIYPEDDWNPQPDKMILNEEQISIRLTGYGLTNNGNYRWYYYLKPAEIEYEFAHENGYVFAYKTEAGTYVTAQENLGMSTNILFGMADKSGDILIENNYRYPFEFHDGLALITEFEDVVYEDHEEYDGNIRTTVDQKRGIADIYGRLIVEPFSNLSVAKAIDPLMEYRYRGEVLYNKEDGIFHTARLLEDGTYVIKDYKGSEIVNDFALKYGYDTAKAEGDLYYVEKDGLSGIVSNTNDVLVPVKYAAVLSFNASKFSFRYVREQLRGILADEFTSKIRKLTDGSMLVNVKDANGKIGVYKIYDDGNEPTVTTTTTTSTTAVDTPDVTTTTTTKVPDIPEKTYEMGDINGDGAIDALDASDALIAYALNATNRDMGLTAGQMKAADVNKDTYIDAMDASLILGYYAFIATGGKGTIGEYLNN